ncbi:hypothetical protein AJ79_07074 [Helicocarpus griseus UAMH5409]|uniref:Uncharacterized protein n=1 Tax=Helicocarpus griseus UAMH5409 TaxID=1447875 RepID=A0A2B7X7B1_9EURO|nr:hypothetical protein AJ79_07074 [Helicocarpus griseus UAMH5409]
MRFSTILTFLFAVAPLGAVAQSTETTCDWLAHRSEEEFLKQLDLLKKGNDEFIKNPKSDQKYISHAKQLQEYLKNDPKLIKAAHDTQCPKRNGNKAARQLDDSLDLENLPVADLLKGLPISLPNA